eukprot:scaffold1580_cov58-Phaeocystis_antarctica.AAC.2
MNTNVERKRRAFIYLCIYSIYLSSVPAPCLVRVALSRRWFNPCTACRVAIRLDTLARGGSRARASCTVPRLRVRPLVSNNEDLNSLKQPMTTDAPRSCKIYIHAHTRNTTRQDIGRD